MNTSKNKGFTMVETMIFLAVSSVIFVSVAALISGQLNKTQARDSVDSLESSLRGVLNDVSNGYYPETGNTYTCLPGALDQPIVTAVAGTDNRGTLPNCLIVGKKLTFNSDSYTVDTMVGLREPTASASPLDKMVSIPTLMETRDYKWGLKLKTPPASPFFILNTNYDADNNDGSQPFVSGAQKVGIYTGAPGSLAVVNSETLVCFYHDNPAKPVSLVLAKEGSLSVSIDYQGVGC